MSARQTTWLASGAGAVIVVFAVASLVLTYPNRAAMGSVSLIDAANLLVPVTLAGLGALIASRQPHNRIGWIILGISGAIAVNSIATQVAIAVKLAGPTSSGWATWLAWSSRWTWLLFFPAGLTVLLFVLLPDGRLAGRRWRWLLWADLLYTSALIVLFALDPAPAPLAPHLPLMPNPIGQRAMPPMQGDNGFGFLGSGALVLLLLTVVALVRRLIRSRGDERQQLKWIVYGSSTAIVANVLANVPSVLGLDPAAIVQNVAGLLGFGVVIPASFGVAILKYRLYDIDVVISRTIVYGLLAAFITAVYVGIAVGIGTLIGSGGQPNLALSIMATAIVAVAFQPVRERLQKLANRLVYGKRATPYEVLSQFSARVAESYAADDVLPRMARILADGTGAARADVWLRAGDTLRQAASWPPASGLPVSAPIIGDVLPALLDVDRAVEVRHRGELLGALTATKRKGESLTPVEEKLLTDLAGQAGLVLKNVGLTAELMARLDELRASRQRLVAAQDQERRRLERNLHDGAQQNLVALKVKLGLAEMFAEKDPARAKQTLAELKVDTDEALETLRELARGIYPPLLADKGLAAAVESQARKATLPVQVESDGIRRYPQEVEAAVYFCVLEALQNVQKYAGASSAVVRLSELERHLHFEVYDDGRGFDPAAVVRGSGLTNMDDRLDALGGKLTIRGELGQFTQVSGSVPLLIAEALG